MDEAIIDRPVASAEGGAVFTVGDWDRLARFLITGTDQGTYYVGAKALTVENAQVVIRCLGEDPERTIKTITRASAGNMAPTNSPALMALAMATVVPTRVEDRRMAWAAMPLVVRYGTHLFHFFLYRKALSGKWVTNRGVRTAVAAWYAERRGKDEARAWMPLAYEVTKYQKRDLVSHADILRTMHPDPVDPVQDAIFKYVLTRDPTDLPDGSPVKDYLIAIEELQKTDSEVHAAKLIADHRLPREVVPTHFLNGPDVWAALCESMPMTAMVRNLPKLTSVGLLADQAWVDLVTDRLTDRDVLRGAGIHPISLLTASRAYRSGRSPNLIWAPNPQVVEALEEAFYHSFAAVTPTNKRIRLAVDTSGSMEKGSSSGLTPREIAAAMAIVTARSEPNAEIVGFSSSLQKDITVGDGDSLDDVMRKIRTDQKLTHARLPITDALEGEGDFDAFVFYTDSQTADTRTPGGKHGTFAEVLADYRTTGVADARLAVVAATAESFSLNDPADPFGLDIAGFSPDVPGVIASFIAGGIADVPPTTGTTTVPRTTNPASDGDARTADAPAPLAVAGAAD